MQRPRTPVLAAFVFLSVLCRLMPWALHHFFGMSIDPNRTIYPWNFSPFMPVCLFSAAYLADRKHVFALMLGAWFIGDVGIGLLAGKLEYAFYPSQIAIYAGYVLLISTGFLLRSKRSFPAIAGTGLLSASLFFVVSNFGVWAIGDGTLYPHTAAGLRDCYAAAIPFFRNSLVSMAVFLPLLFSRVTLAQTAAEPAGSLAAQTG